MIRLLILEFLLSASPELEDVICHALEAFSQRWRIINVTWMFSQAQWLFKCYKWFRRQREGRKKTPWEPGLCRSRAAWRRNARENKPAPVSATVMNYHPFGSPEYSFDTRATWTIGGMLATTAPCAPGAHGGNLRNDTRWNSKYLKQSFTFLLMKEFTPLWSSWPHSSTRRSQLVLWRRLNRPNVWNHMATLHRRQVNASSSSLRWNIALRTASLCPSLCLYRSSLHHRMFLLALRSPVCVHQQTQEEEPATVLTDGQSQ